MLTGPQVILQKEIRYILFCNLLSPRPVHPNTKFTPHVCLLGPSNLPFQNRPLYPYVKNLLFLNPSLPTGVSDVNLKPRRPPRFKPLLSEMPGTEDGD